MLHNFCSQHWQQVPPWGRRVGHGEQHGSMPPVSTGCSFYFPDQGKPDPPLSLLFKLNTGAGTARALRPSGLSCNLPTAASLKPCKQVVSILLSCCH